MYWRDFIPLIYFLVTAVILGIVGWVTLSPAIKWFAPVIALGLISTGLGINGLIISGHIGKKMTQMDATLTRLEDLQKEIQKEQHKKESSGAPIVASLQAMSQYYFDYIANQERTNEEH